MEFSQLLEYRYLIANIVVKHSWKYVVMNVYADYCAPGKWSIQCCLIDTSAKFKMISSTADDNVKRIYCPEENISIVGEFPTNIAPQGLTDDTMITGIFMCEIEWKLHDPSIDFQGYAIILSINFNTSMFYTYEIGGLVQKRCNSSANALELRLSCTNPSKFYGQITPMQFPC